MIFRIGVPLEFDEEKLQDRAKVMRKLIRIMEHLRKLNNFNSIMAIMAGMNCSAVHRLKFTKEEIGHAMDRFQSLEEELSSNNAYKNYRAILASVDPPCIPYLGVYLTDLTFIEDGNPDHIKGLVNYKKRRLYFDVIEQIQQYQQRSYNLQYVSQIGQFFQKLLWKDEDALYAASLKREPRGTESKQELE